MPNIKVQLDPKSSPPVTVDPVARELAPGTHNITWTRGKGESFDFVALKFPSNRRCFSDAVVGCDKIVVRDKHTGTKATTGTFRYTLTVTDGRKQYSSHVTMSAAYSSVSFLAARGGDPTIRNT